MQLLLGDLRKRLRGKWGRVEMKVWRKDEVGTVNLGVSHPAVFIGTLLRLNDYHLVGNVALAYRSNLLKLTRNALIV